MIPILLSPLKLHVFYVLVLNIGLPLQSKAVVIILIKTSAFASSAVLITSRTFLFKIKEICVDLLLNSFVKRCFIARAVYRKMNSLGECYPLKVSFLFNIFIELCL